ncbi:MAG: hypothetical protein WC441_05305 [Patescibacteria group bacterium]
MGRNITKKNYNQLREAQHKAYFSGIHRARVEAVHIDKGTVEVRMDGLPSIREVTIPLLGLSLPYQKDKDDKTYMTSSSWGRYIPQEGDMLLVGFNSNGEAYALGYHAVFYQGMKYLDDQRVDKGGIGWGESSGRSLKPGDWDFKSSRGCSFYMGYDAKLGSGPHSIALNKTQGDVTLTSGLVQTKYGEASTARKGDARRFLLPTDSAETYIFSIIPGNSPKKAQESYDVVKYGSLVGAPIELSRIHHGEVVDETTFTAMVPAINTSLKPLVLLVGTGVRMLHSVKNPSGMVDSYISAIDDLGNYGVSAISATGFQWMTPAATWQIDNLNTIQTSTATYSLTSPAITLTGTASITLTGPAITVTGSTSIVMTAPTISALGTVTLGATGGLPLVKATPQLLAAWSTYFTAAAAAWNAVVALLPAVAPAAAAATALASLLASSATTTTTAM